MSFKEEEEETILTSAFQSIGQAFAMQYNKFEREVERNENIISSLQTQNQILQEDNAKLKEEKMYILQENNQLKSKIEKLISSLNNKQSKIQMIKQSINDEHQYDNKKYLKKPKFMRYENYMNHSHITERHNSSMNYTNNGTNISQHSITKDIDFSQKKYKYDSIEQRINKLKTNFNSFIPHQSYQKIDVFETIAYHKDDYSKSKQYELSNKFLNECRIALAPTIYERMTTVFKDFREGKKTDKDVTNEVKDLLKNNTRLINLFDIVFETD